MEDVQRVFPGQRIEGSEPDTLIVSVIPESSPLLSL